MTLKIDSNGNVNGYYTKDAQKACIVLSGKVKDSQIELVEDFDYSRKFIQGFKGILSNQVFKGLWIDSTKKTSQAFLLKLEKSLGCEKPGNFDLFEKEQNPNSLSTLSLLHIYQNTYKFVVTVGNDNGCNGFLSGIVSFSKNNTAVFSDLGCKELKFSLKENEVLLEEDSCQYHGYQCAFAGKYKKPK